MASVDLKADAELVANKISGSSKLIEDAAALLKSGDASNAKLAAVVIKIRRKCRVTDSDGNEQVDFGGRSSEYRAAWRLIVTKAFGVAVLDDRKRMQAISAGMSYHVVKALRASKEIPEAQTREAQTPAEKLNSATARASRAAVKKSAQSLTAPKPVQMVDALFAARDLIANVADRIAHGEDVVGDLEFAVGSIELQLDGLREAIAEPGSKVEAEPEPEAEVEPEAEAS